MNEQIFRVFFLSVASFWAKLADEHKICRHP